MEHRILFLTVFAIIVYGTLILASNIGIGSIIQSSFGNNSDLSYFQARSSLILNNGILYRDLPCESPPIINYLFVPVQIFGGAGWEYQIYFSFFALITAIMMYVLLKRWNEHYAFVVSILCLFSPFILGDSTFGIEDEVIVVFITMLGILLYKVRAERLGAAMVAVGFWTKFIPGYHFSVPMVDDGNETRKIDQHRPVRSCFPDGGSTFPYNMSHRIHNFPDLLYDGTGWRILCEPLRDKSSWHRRGVDIRADRTIGDRRRSIFVLFLLLYQEVRHLERQLGEFTVFLCVYPEAHLKYYAIPYLLLTVWAAKDLKLLFRMLPIYVILLVAQGYAVAPSGLNPSYSWIIAIVLLIVGDILLLDTVRRAIKTSSFIDGEPEKKDAGASD